MVFLMHRAAIRPGLGTLGLGLMLAACTGSQGETGASAIVTISAEPSGSNCPSGGQRIDTGVDSDKSGKLESGEIDSTAYACNGTATLVDVVPEAKGDNCAYGGQAIRRGADGNDNGKLDSKEVTGTKYVCNAAATDDPAIVQRLAWSQTAKEPYMTGHSDELVANAPKGSGALGLERIASTPRKKGGFGKSGAEIDTWNPNTRQVFDEDTQGARLPYYTLQDDGSLGEPSGILRFADDIPELTPQHYGINSVAISEDTLVIAVEVKDEDFIQIAGRLAFYDVSTTTPVFIKSVTVSAMPDMVGFTHDGSKIIYCGEGEPPMTDTGAIFSDWSKDPEGTIGIVTRPKGGWTKVSEKDVKVLDFKDFDDGGSREKERPPGLHRIAPAPEDGGPKWSQMFEPEYMTTTPDDSVAWVVLQEMNAVAIVDLTTQSIKAIRSFGLKNGLLPGNEFDASDKDGRVRLASWPVYMMYQPDTIHSYQAKDGKTYFVTANEGDPRNQDWGWYENEKVSALKLDPAAFPGKDEWQRDDLLGSLVVTKTIGDADGDGLYENLYAFGGRSFAIWDEDVNLVYDSGNQFERITAARYGINFNNYSKDKLPDGWSQERGPEPEALEVGVIAVPGADGKLEDHTFAFVGLEKMGGYMVYDVSDPVHPQYVTYFSNRHPELGPEFEDAKADLAPEGTVFIPAEQSPTGKPLLIPGNEVSGNTSVYEITVNVPASE